MTKETKTFTLNPRLHIDAVEDIRKAAASNSLGNQLIGMADVLDKHNLHGDEETAAMDYFFFLRGI